AYYAQRQRPAAG
ncbi:transposase, partial [Mycobacterium tuberculosis UT0124]